MSAWVHVAAIARIDYLPILNDGTVVDFDTIFGKECLWGEGNFKYAFAHKDEFFPMGSEGSLRKTIWINPHENHADQYTVSIFGDLRNVDDGDWIIEWFKKKLNKLWVRQATITVNSTYYGITTWTFDPESREITPPDSEDND